MPTASSRDTPTSACDGAGEGGADGGAARGTMVTLASTRGGDSTVTPRSSRLPAARRKAVALEGVAPRLVASRAAATEAEGPSASAKVRVRRTEAGSTGPRFVEAESICGVAAYFFATRQVKSTSAEVN